MKEINLFSWAIVKTSLVKNYSQETTEELNLLHVSRLAVTGCQCLRWLWQTASPNAWHASPFISLSEIKNWRMIDKLALKRDKTKCIFFLNLSIPVIDIHELGALSENMVHTNSVQKHKRGICLELTTRVINRKTGWYFLSNKTSNSNYNIYFTSLVYKVHCIPILKINKLW